MRYKAVLFDLDGTLIDSLADLTSSVNYIMKLYGLDEHTGDEVKSYIGDGTYKLFERAFPAGTPRETIDGAIEIYRPYYAEKMKENTVPYDGITGLLDRLKKDGYIIGVVSNKFRKSTELLCRKYFPQADIALGEMEAEGVRRKPHPDMIIRAAQELGIETDDILYVGDSEVDIYTAENSGIRCISVSWGYRDKDYLVECGAEAVADDPDELYRKIKEFSEI